MTWKSFCTSNGGHCTEPRMTRLQRMARTMTTIRMSKLYCSPAHVSNATRKDIVQWTVAVAGTTKEARKVASK
jgi:hypothetical protein